MNTMNKFTIFLLSIVFLTGCGHQAVTPVNEIPPVLDNQNNVVSSPAPSAEVIPPVIINSMNAEIDQNKTYIAVLHTTEGDIEIALNNKQTPITVNNFVTLSKKDFYDNTIFHRVLKGFMIQGGDPTGTGSGGPGYRFDDEPFQGEYIRGTVAMANAGKNTNGSQFFIMHADVPLQKDYVIFGHVTKGLDVVDKIATAKVSVSEMGEPSKPVNPAKIKSVDIVEK